MWHEGVPPSEYEGELVLIRLKKSAFTVDECLHRIIVANFWLYKFKNIWTGERYDPDEVEAWAVIEGPV